MMQQLEDIGKDVAVLKEQITLGVIQAQKNEKAIAGNEAALADLKKSLDPIIDILALVERVATGIITASKWAKVLIPLVVLASMIYAAYTAIKSGHALPDFTHTKVGE